MNNGNTKGQNEPLTMQRALPGTGHYATGYNKCFHSGSKPLWTLPNGHSIYAAQESELAGCSGHGVILDCTGYANKLPQQQRDAERAKAAHEAIVCDVGADQFAALRTHVAKATPRVHINWPDGGEPPLAPAFWEAFLALADGSVCVCCFGSHGRTGTALAALYMAQHGPACTDLTLAEVVATVRRKHCEEAIETTDQILYLETVADFYGVIVSDDIIEGSYAYRAPVSFTAKPATTTGVDVGAVTRAVVNGRDVATGLPVTASVPAANGKARKRARKTHKATNQGVK